MARVCDITGKRSMTGYNVSFSNAKTKRKFNPNLQKKKFWVAEKNAWVTLKVSTSALRTINRFGISAVLERAIAKGHTKG